MGVGAGVRHSRQTRLLSNLGDNVAVTADGPGNVRTRNAGRRLVRRDRLRAVRVRWLATKEAFFTKKWRSRRLQHQQQRKRF